MICDVKVSFFGQKVSVVVDRNDIPVEIVLKRYTVFSNKIGELTDSEFRQVAKSLLARKPNYFQRDIFDEVRRVERLLPKRKRGKHAA